MKSSNQVTPWNPCVEIPRVDKVGDGLFTLVPDTKPPGFLAATTYFREQIVSGGVRLEDLPAMLATFGFMDTATFASEIAKRIALSND
jgi:hypothetical protein